MCDIGAGDLVRIPGADCVMLVIGRANDEFWHPDEEQAVFCAWEQENLLYEEVFPVHSLVLVRQERRRVPRGGELQFPARSNQATG